MSDVSTLITILFLAVKMATAASPKHQAPMHGSKTGTARMALTIAGKFSLSIPETAKVMQTGPPSIGPYESYRFSTAHMHFDILVWPYRTSEADVSGQCTVSSESYDGDANGPVFCEGDVLSHSLRTKLGTAKWAHAIYKNSRTMNSPEPPARTAYVTFSSPPFR